ncbi:MAG: chemotaxis protein CheR [Novosphingobium sp. 28-62-57]|uniref:CheR family methyltransferase n=1 Tax=unclassified Novosphingobium TaxID=2644732 RepID=UPI000BCA3974|nr:MULTISPECIES: protein-glutamate O-methyltransferase CheR [unclassified Novosphingobium]OYW48152.1 MAG: chemotaxis protein CheR [Novosphingobium sp. 12-63-9]OYZ08906.1 MAG: chemotaxis protein CheR [Novosphingobium sp. 28-62-57]OZA38062.1 MAG: chemotaxis protein CheR [Novosphingobium sp. 17-62-9]HQS68733.1 protein-glutamate O-methyltransferase CheR [Novosphingobium sp.]
MTGAQARRMADNLDRISPRNFKALAALITTKVGIKLPASKQTMLEGRLRRRIMVTGHASIDDYCADLLSGAAGAEELGNLINAVTTNKTDFFREPAHFDYLASTILPGFRDDGRTRIRCWSAAASTGAEAYTLAMVCDDFYQRHRAPDYEIIATDIDTNVLATGIRAIYPTEQVAPVPPELRRRYVLEPKQAGRGEVRICGTLRRKVGFGQLNLMDRNYPLGAPLDIILCRNVLIYFERDIQRAVIGRMFDRLRPGGFLILGHSESLGDFDGALEQVASNVFMKKA